MMNPPICWYFHKLWIDSSISTTKLKKNQVIYISRNSPKRAKLKVKLYYVNTIKSIFSIFQYRLWCRLCQFYLLVNSILTTFGIKVYIIKNKVCIAHTNMNMNLHLNFAFGNLFNYSLSKTFILFLVFDIIIFQ